MTQLHKNMATRFRETFVRVKINSCHKSYSRFRYGPLTTFSCFSPLKLAPGGYSCLYTQKSRHISWKTRCTMKIHFRFICSFILQIFAFGPFAFTHLNLHNMLNVLLQTRRTFRTLGQSSQIKLLRRPMPWFPWPLPLWFFSWISPLTFPFCNSMLFSTVLSDCELC